MSLHNKINIMMHTPAKNEIIMGTESDQPFTYEPRREKTGFLHMRTKKNNADQLHGNLEADQRLCFRYIDSKIPLLLKYEISSL